MKSLFAPVIAGAVVPLLCLACQHEEPIHKKKALELPPPAPAGVEVDSAKVALFAPLPAVAESKENPITEPKVALGRMLFFDARLSKADDVSCNTCHDLTKYGVDGKDLSVGHQGHKETRNSPTVYNAAFQFVQFWDGRADTVEAQTKVPVISPVEMAMPNAESVEKKLTAIPGYVDAFKKAFPDDAKPITFDDFERALGAFERKLVTPSKWDKFLEGDKTALGDDEKKGFLAFVDAGCPTCHVGPLVGGTMYQKLGLEKPWPNQSDLGRGAVTKSPSDNMMFKVAQLRNVEKTAPYFHDASAKTLEEAVRMMADHQLKKPVSEDAVKAIVTWLKTLTGDIPAELIRRPQLPESPGKKVVAGKK